MISRIIKLLCCAHIVYRVSQTELYNYKKGRQDACKLLMCSDVNIFQARVVKVLISNMPLPVEKSLLVVYYHETQSPTVMQ